MYPFSIEMTSCNQRVPFQSRHVVVQKARYEHRGDDEKERDLKETELPVSEILRQHRDI